MTDDPQPPGPEAERPYTVIFSRQARRNLHENLTYRIIYRINEDKRTAEIHSIRHRRDFYRT